MSSNDAGGDGAINTAGSRLWDSVEKTLRRCMTALRGNVEPGQLCCLQAPDSLLELMGMQPRHLADAHQLPQHVVVDSADDAEVVATLVQELAEVPPQAQALEPLFHLRGLRHDRAFVIVRSQVEDLWLGAADAVAQGHVGQGRAHGTLGLLSAPCGKCNGGQHARPARRGLLLHALGLVGSCCILMALFGPHCIIGATLTGRSCAFQRCCSLHGRQLMGVAHGENGCNRQRRYRLCGVAILGNASVCGGSDLRIGCQLHRRMQGLALQGLTAVADLLLPGGHGRHAFSALELAEVEELALCPGCAGSTRARNARGLQG
mmetsp:Transcript_55351/g.177514  ORF Transcript_55351/g.177514 Transcript_55351/m.177514 type:complete len:319 (+) Transcript_55351:152-1108(+)